MVTVVESAEVIEVQSILPPGQRVLFGLLALFPLIAPYELILKINWENYFNLFFLFALVISLGAMAVSIFLVWFAIAGLDSQLRFDRGQGTVTYSVGAPVVKWQTTECPMSDIASIQVEKNDWSDGSPSYSLLAMTTDRREFKAGSSWSRNEMEGICERVSSFIP